MTPAQNITRHFNGDWQGNQGSFPTPGHSKSDRGITVKDAAGDDVVFYCHNDQAFDWRGMKDECRRLGLLSDRQRANDNCDRGGHTLRAREVASWEYTDGDGTVLYRKVRMALPNGGKSYRFEHPDGRGGWKPKRGDAAQVPYRLPDILAAEHAAILYMTEGEKQADKLAAWGFLATSSKDWRGFDFAGYVKGRTVVILPDNDDEGAKIAESAREAVERAEGRAVILTLPDLPAKGDVMDWRGTADDLRRLTAQALAQPVETFAMADLTVWANTAPTPKAFVMPGFIPRDDVVIVTGDGGTNKSTLALQISACAAAGKPFLGMDVAAGPALYVTAEDDNRENHWRLSKIAASIRTTLHALAGKLHVVSLRGRLNTYGNMFNVSRQMLVNDHLGALADILTLMAGAAAEVEATILAAIINAGPVLSDGLPVFDEAHGNVAAERGRPSIATLDAGRLAMRQQKDLDGVGLIDANPKYLLVPVALQTAAETLIASATIPSTQPTGSGASAGVAFTGDQFNPFAGKLEPIADPRLTNPAAWYLFADPAFSPALEYGYLDGQEAPQTFSEEGWRVDGTEYKVRHDFGAGWMDHRMAWKNPGAA